ncbi:MAG: prolyl oligopeptidase family serine peptidase [Bacteroidetes bacterium]|nr:prolyl oligopeptidase family serine peptidase [Bacteroidota bacterium]MBT7041098.1 prolyl oligopeptidase family serine peptidase [Bacteroidota bacterium]
MIKAHLKRIENYQVLTSKSNLLLVDIHYAESNLAKPVIIFSHGFKSFKNWGALDLIADYFASMGYIFLKFNHSHNGTTHDAPAIISDSEKFGNNTIELELNDLEAVIDLCLLNDLDELKINSEAIYLMGHSRGGSNSIIKASENKHIKKLITWAAFNDYEKTWNRFYDMDEWKKQGVNYRENKKTAENLPVYYSLYENFLKYKERFNIKHAVEKLEIPMLAIHGIDDEFIPYEEAIQLKKWNKNIDINILPYTSHNFGSEHPYTKNTLSDDIRIVCDESIKFLQE